MTAEVDPTEPPSRPAARVQTNSTEEEEDARAAAAANVAVDLVFDQMGLPRPGVDGGVR